MSLLYCHEHLANGHLQELRHEARLEQLRAQARAASVAESGAGRHGWPSALRVGPLRQAVGFVLTGLHLSD